MDELASSANLKAKTYFFLILMIVLGSVGNTILDKGMKGLGTIDFSSRAAIWQGAFHTFTSGTIWLGIGCMLLFMVCHMLVLSWADYSFVMPFQALAYALVPLFGFLFLGDRVAATRWAGIVVIVAGVILINRTPDRTTHAPELPLTPPFDNALGPTLDRPARPSAGSR
jgi:drug/metabolite transporter (DMT)-like permease